MELKHIDYRRLNARQKENFNFQKVSAVLAEYGFTTMRLSADWKGADFIAQHVDESTVLKVQLKSRVTFCKKYLEKGLYIAFADSTQWYLYPHDELVQEVFKKTNIANTRSWKKPDGEFHWKQPPAWLRELLEEHKISGTTEPTSE